MQWTEEVQLRFNELRQKELAGTLSANEKGELAELFAVLGADERQSSCSSIAWGKVTVTGHERVP
jgi:hypothetical protein